MNLKKTVCECQGNFTKKFKKILRTLFTWRQKKHLVNAHSFHFELGNFCHGNDATNMGAG
jgi:DNA gyrase inhibitor GyrI